MRLDRRNKIQLLVFAVVTLIAGASMAFGYARIPELFGVGRYTVTMQLPQSGGLYATGNVTYRGVEVGRVDKVDLTDTGVVAELSLKSGVDIPSDVKAEVHSQSAVGEQFVALLPRSGDGPPLKNGDVIPLSDTSVPPDINTLLGAANTGLEAIPQDNLKVAVDESYTAVGGLGPELSRLVKGSTTLSIDARANLDSLTALIDQSKPVLDSQTETSDSIDAWAAHLAAISDQLRDHDDSVAGLIDNGGPAAAEAKQLFDRLKPSLPILLANLAGIGDVAVTYQPALEQILVLMPQTIAALQGGVLADAHTKPDYRGAYLDFNLNLNAPPPCKTGYLPPQQLRSPALVDAPDRPAGDLYCRVPQDSQIAVRGARNLPCLTRPGKRAPTVKMCESDEQYVPLNDGYYWKGDPNATLSGQGVPQQPSAPEGAPAPAPPPIAIAQYDPNTGSYVGPDGQVYTQANLAQGAKEEQTWQTMLIPPGS
ncbi:MULTISPECIES: MlaD family protein [unclassified Mycobacterium]|uniref:MlaD family protein n=1 Tax=unclassified Mycobacterium TaxID=2642494 RepID=UPI0029C80395|nr:MULTISPECIES: MlaD family protein [unclassified Mycobacterium]